MFLSQPDGSQKMKTSTKIWAVFGFVLFPICLAFLIVFMPKKKPVAAPTEKGRHSMMTTCRQLTDSVSRELFDYRNSTTKYQAIDSLFHDMISHGCIDEARQAMMTEKNMLMRSGGYVAHSRRLSVIDSRLMGTIWSEPTFFDVWNRPGRIGRPNIAFGHHGNYNDNRHGYGRHGRRW